MRRDTESAEVDRLVPVMREHGRALVTDMRDGTDHVSDRLVELRATLAGHTVPHGVRLARVNALVSCIAETAGLLLAHPGTGYADVHDAARR